MQNILLIQLKRIGDVVLTAPAAVALKQAFPEAHLTMLMDAAFSPLADVLPVNECLFLKRGALNARVWSTVLMREWSACLEFSGTDRGALLAAASRAELRSTYKRHSSLLARVAFNRFVEADVKALHTVDYHVALTEVGNSRSVASLRVSETVSQKISDLLREKGARGRYAVLHPGSARAEKMWSARNWSAVASYIANDLGLGVILTGGADPAEIAQIREICENSPLGRIVSFAGETTLPELTALIAGADVFVGVDTGASHIADQLGIPAVVLYGTSNPRNWGPRGANGRAVGGAGFSRYPHNPPKCCMQEIPVENAIAALRDFFPDQSETLGQS